MPGSKKRPPSSASSKEGFSKLFKKPRPIQSLVSGLRLTMALTLTLILTLIHPRTPFLPRSQLSQLPHWTQTRSAVLSARLQSLQTPVTLALTAPHHAMLITVLHDQIRNEHVVQGQLSYDRVVPLRNLLEPAR